MKEGSLLLALALLIPASLQLRCTHCPTPLVSPSACSQCEGDLCFIVVNAWFNGTLSAGCIDLEERDRGEFAERRKDCTRELSHNRTVCACNTADLCNDPMTPLAEFDFISAPILEGYDLEPGGTARTTLTTTTTEPRVVLPTDEPPTTPPPFTTTSTTVSTTSTTTFFPITSTTSPPTSTLIYTRPPPPLRPPLSTRKQPRREDEHEEGLIQVKSSVFIKPRNFSRVLPPQPPLSSTSLAPTPTSTTSSPDIGIVLPTDDAMGLSGVYRAIVPPAPPKPTSDGHVLPTDVADRVEPPVLTVKSGVMRVKEQEDPPTRTNRVEDVVTEMREVPTRPEERHPTGEGSVQEAEVSSGVKIGVGGNKPSSLKSPDSRRFSSRSDGGVNSSQSASLISLLLLLLLSASLI